MGIENLTAGVKRVYINMGAITALAGATTADDLTKYDKLPSNVKDALKTKMAEREKQAAFDAAEEIIKLIDLSDDVIQASVDNIREFRKKISEYKHNLTMVSIAKDYGLATNNFIPLMAALGMRFDSEINPELMCIPESFIKSRTNSNEGKKAKTKAAKK